ncbi:nitrile hydratase subunit beta [Ferrovibrio sp.]|uniref:nitrile hydratase subunit beta n=1 Tax=Ferrovibrio sp. TaxID=1917215 RepID=UPI0025B89678|nr:nitrile hydratase subunit beta [Ferrovibrio sp.]MBX3453923.1 nitrile hydratase subunit beta [Ferrovibrio sp.]
MNGIHDMGGMDGFGPVKPEADEPLFHADWEKRALAITLATGSLGQWNIDASRHARELTPPALYLNSSYYERWMSGLERLLVQRGLLTEAELQSGEPNGQAPIMAPIKPAVTADQVPAILARGGPTTRSEGKPAGLRIGQRVRAININPAGHTRLPRYLRGKTGVVMMDHGLHVFADSNAHFKGEQPQHLYNVVFEADEVWGADARFKGTVRADLWEAHLEAV